MPRAIVTGSGGLIGSESVGTSSQRGLDVTGLEIDMRARLFGADASTPARPSACSASYGDAFRLARGRHPRRDAVDRSSPRRAQLELVVHTAAQPSHDWAASDPQTDFTINANGTLNLLEATRRHAPSATFIYCSTNKIYGDHPNRLPLIDARLGSSSPRTTATRGGSTPRCRSMRRRTRCSGSPRRRPTCSSRNTAATSGCRRCACEAAA